MDMTALMRRRRWGWGDADCGGRGLAVFGGGEAGEPVVDCAGAHHYAVSDARRAGGEGATVPLHAGGDQALEVKYVAPSVDSMRNPDLPRFTRLSRRLIRDVSCRDRRPHHARQLVADEG